MRLGSGQVLTIMSRMHGAATPKQLEARLKYFQRMSFPSATLKVGTGGRADYEAFDIFRLIIAFELLAAGVAPMLAVSLVDAAPARFEVYLARLWLIRAEDADALLLVHADGFGTKRGGGGSLRGGTKIDLDIWERTASATGRRLVVVNAARMVAQMDVAFESLPNGAAMDPDRARAGLDAWATALAPPQQQLRTGT